jgi:anti-sigma factor RsiW
MSREHVADAAELYALGALRDDETAAIDAHLRVCAQCALAFASAESDVALIASVEAHHAAPLELNRRVERMLYPARRPWVFGAALAAAVIVGFLPSAFLWSENRSMHDAMLAQNAAIARLMDASHRNAAFQGVGANIAADVSYARDGSWYVVVVRGVSKRLTVVWMHDGARSMLGSTVPHGDVAMLYLPKSHPMDRLALMDGDRIVAQATLSWQKTPPDRQGARSG